MSSVSEESLSNCMETKVAWRTHGNNRIAGSIYGEL